MNSTPVLHQRSLRQLLLGLTLMAAGIAEVSAQVPIIQPGAPGQPSRQLSVEEASNLAGIKITNADVKFMQGMISHHAQALEMTALVNERSDREAMELLAQRIALSQEDEIAMMQEWLRDRELTVPAEHSHHEDGFELMPGMLSAEDFAELEQADKNEFDALFLQAMIEHHQGALTMVEELLEKPGSAQDSVMYAFTSDITSDQTSEIERMTAMLSGFSPDPRVNLAAGFYDAGQAALNMELLASRGKPDGFFDPANPEGLPMERVKAEEEEVETLQAAPAATPEPGSQPVTTTPAQVSGAAETPKSDDEEEEDEQSEPRPSLLDFANTDISFAGDVLIAGNYHGFNAYDISRGREPELLSSIVCPGGQGDVSVIGNLLIYSVEQTRGRLDCGLQGVAEPESPERFRGIRIFDVSDFRMPVQVGAVQTCRGSHTHTVVTDPDDPDNIYIYGSGTSRVRPGEEMEGCIADSPYEDAESALFSIDVIQIPVARPQDASVINRPRIFADPQSGVIAGLWEGGDHGPDTQTTSETNQCHDITAYPEIGLAAGACSGNGILLDISDPVNPVRLDQVIDTGFAYWHSATFNNDGTKVIFTDEWGGGSRPRCRAFDPKTWGADAIYDIVDRKLQFRSHYKMPAPQTEQENCVAHNGSLVPVPGRDILVQAWYQGGISVIDFTDSANPREIAFFDRGPIDSEKLIMGGYWSSYWYGGLIYATEIARGLDVFALTSSDFLTGNELAAASFKTPGAAVNAQQQQRHVWPHEPVVALAYLDQLERSGSLSEQSVGELRTALENATTDLNGGGRNATLALQLEQLAAEVAGAGNDDRGVSGSRLSNLATTLNGVAARLR